MTLFGDGHQLRTHIPGEPIHGELIKCLLIDSVVGFEVDCGQNVLERRELGGREKQVIDRRQDADLYREDRRVEQQDLEDDSRAASALDEKWIKVVSRL